MTAIPKPYLVSLTIFLLGGAFASLLMYYTALAKHLDGLYNESIFLTAAFFGMMAALTLMFYHGVDCWRYGWGKHEPPCEPERGCEEQEWEGMTEYKFLVTYSGKAVVTVDAECIEEAKDRLCNDSCSLEDYANIDNALEFEITIEKDLSWNANVASSLQDRANFGTATLS
jgi:hypothetical protein